MPIEIRMPALSPTMTEGNIARWLKKEGDAVHSGDVIAEIETDKATMEYEAADEGRLGKIIVPEGAQGIKVNQPIALLLEEGEDPAALDKFAAGAPVEDATARAAQPASAARAETPSASTLTAPAGAATPHPLPNPPPQAGEGRVGVPAVSENGRVFASPLARRMAIHAGIDLAAIRGSGPQGRIVKADIERTVGQPGSVVVPVAPARLAAPPVAKSPVPAFPDSPPYSAKPHSAMRRVIARRMTESKQTVPHFYMSVDCTIDDLLAIRTKLNAKSESQHLSINDFVIRAAALALRQVPAANASWTDDAILLWERADVAVAVALDDGLITPIVRGADQKGLAQIAAEMRDLGERARSGKLALEEFQGGTFTISNLGMYGIREFAAVINPPQGCILAVGAGEQRPVVKDGQLAVATVMTCTLSCDHRVVDGAVGAQLLAAFKKLIEDPLTMLL
jgi:pyruvate dehydrogenase E2 component (dihydrolipoamide acetyltransferase)